MKNENIKEKEMAFERDVVDCKGKRELFWWIGCEEEGWFREKKNCFKDEFKRLFSCFNRKMINFTVYNL